ncbi:MAG: ATP-binding cassette domain-containing protein [Fimbriiglobus sp.]
MPTIRYPISPKRRSLATARVMDLFGLDGHEAPYTVAENFSLPVEPGQVVLFTGPSGSGKSSLLRAIGAENGAVDANTIALPDLPLIEALPGSLEPNLGTLAACGLGEARLMLRTPSELSEGQRYRFRLAYAIGQGNAVLIADEFGATLDRTLAKVVSFNLRKLATRTKTTVLCATTHDDLTEDLNPDIHVRCRGEGVIDVTRTVPEKKPISFASELRMTEGTTADWDQFAHWHYRSHDLGFVKRVNLLWHHETPIGIIIFATPVASIRRRTEYFGLTNPRSRVALAALNQQLWVLQRVVLHPTYRGAGIAANFVDQACRAAPIPWIETLTAMGQANPFFERAGFLRLGPVRKESGPEPIYYIRDNRTVYSKT